MNLANANDRLEAARLWERFCADLAEHPEHAKVRLVSGIQVQLRDAAEGRPSTVFEPVEEGR